MLAPGLTELIRTVTPRISISLGVGCYLHYLAKIKFVYGHSSETLLMREADCASEQLTQAACCARSRSLHLSGGRL